MVVDCVGCCHDRVLLVNGIACDVYQIEMIVTHNSNHLVGLVDEVSRVDGIVDVNGIDSAESR